MLNIWIKTLHINHGTNLQQREGKIIFRFRKVFGTLLQQSWDQEGKFYILIEELKQYLGWFQTNFRMSVGDSLQILASHLRR